MINSKFPLFSAPKKSLKLVPPVNDIACTIAEILAWIKCMNWIIWCVLYRELHLCNQCYIFICDIKLAMHFSSMLRVVSFWCMVMQFYDSVIIVTKKYLMKPSYDSLCNLARKQCSNEISMHHWGWYKKYSRLLAILMNF